MSITRLPNELLDIICSHLDHSEWLSLRSTCRPLYETSWRIFADRYFKSICCMATSESIRQLKYLFRNKALAANIEEIWMIPTVFEGMHNMDQPMFEKYANRREPYQGYQDDTSSRFTLYQEIVSDHLSLAESNECAQVFSECFAHMKNLKSMGLKHYPTDFLLDKRQNVVKCLGLPDLRNKIEFRAFPSSMGLLQRGQVADINTIGLSRLLKSLNGFSHQIKALHTCDTIFCGSISPNVFVTEENYISLSESLEQLEFLHLCICHGKVSEMSTRYTWIDILLTVSSRLKVLEFSQWCGARRDMNQAIFSRLSQTIVLSQLKDLHLHWIQVQPDALKTFIRSAKATLRALSLELVTLTNGDQYLDPSNPTPWRLIWEFLADEISLEKLHLAYLGYRGLKVMIQRSCDSQISSMPDYSIDFNSEIADISFSEWILQFNPVTQFKEDDLGKRKYDGKFIEIQRSDCFPK